MFKVSVAGFFIAFLLLGCGQAPSDDAASDAGAGPAPKKSITIRNPFQEKLLALNDLDRDLTLRRAVRDDGGSCSKISGSKFQESYKGMAMWVAHCTSGDWAVFVAASGTIQARACKDIGTLNEKEKALNLPACHPWPVDPMAPLAEPRWPEPVAPPPPDDKL